MPVAIEGDGKVERVIVERTRLDADGARRSAPARPMRSRPAWWSAASAIAPRRSPACPMTNAPAASPMTTGAIAARPLRGRLGAARADRHDRHQPARRLRDRRDRSPPIIARRRSGKAGRAGLDALLDGARRRCRHLPRLAEDRGRRDRRARATAPRARSSSIVADMLGARGTDDRRIGALRALNSPAIARL